MRQDEPHKVGTEVQSKPYLRVHFATISCMSEMMRSVHPGSIFFFKSYMEGQQERERGRERGDSWGLSQLHKEQGERA